jgi:hypothetical protein
MIRVAASAAFLLLSTAAALAEPEAAAHRGPPACFEEVQRFCADVPFGGGKRIACLAKHKAELGESCKKRLAFMQEVFSVTQEQLKQNKALQAKSAGAAAKSGQPAPAKKPAPPAAQADPAPKPPAAK